MKKYLPFILLALALVAAVGVFFFIRGRGKEEAVEEETVVEIPFEKRPFVSLTPSDDGHWLYLSVEGIKVDATSLDYELLYSLPDGRTQGVPGTVKLEGMDSFERELLLGSESSGTFRYDEGVEKGTLTLRFRSDKGKLVGKLSTEFHLQEASDREFASIDDQFKIMHVEKLLLAQDYVITMETFGVPGNIDGNLQKGPYGAFTSIDNELTWKVTLDGDQVLRWDGSEWEKPNEAGSFSDTGVFITTSSE